jgi:transcriptional regulator GlxA family with amidase domain
MKRKKSVVSKTDQVRLEKVKALIEAHPDIKHTLDSLAKEAGISRAKLIYIFRRHYNISIHQYLLKVRMKFAYTLLRTTELPIKEIAAKAGYSNRQNFTTAFRNYFRKTAAQVQKRRQ